MTLPEWSPLVWAVVLVFGGVIVGFLLGLGMDIEEALLGHLFGDSVGDSGGPSKPPGAD